MLRQFLVPYKLKIVYVTWDMQAYQDQYVLLVNPELIAKIMNCIFARIAHLVHTMWTMRRIIMNNACSAKPIPTAQQDLDLSETVCVTPDFQANCCTHPQMPKVKTDHFTCVHPVLQDHMPTQQTQQTAVCVQPGNSQQQSKPLTKAHVLNVLKVRLPASLD